MSIDQLSSVLAVIVLLGARFVVPVTLTWLLGQILRRVAPQAS